MEPEAVCRLLLGMALPYISPCGNLSLLSSLMQLYLCATQLCFSFFLFLCLCVYMFVSAPPHFCRSVSM